MLFCVALGAVAQQVASTPTSFANLATGYYVLRVSSDDGKASASYLYANDKKVYYDASGSEKTLAGSSIDANTMNYMFYVTNTNGKLYISLWSDHSISWPNISQANNGIWGAGKKDHPGDQKNFEMNSTKGEFTATLSGEAYVLTLTSSYLNNKKATDCTGYVTLRDNNLVGYNDEHSTTWDKTTIAKVQFFAVSNEPRSNNTFTYNLSYNGNVVKSETHTVLFTNASYPAYSTNWSDYYIKVPSVPSGTMKDDETSYTVEVSQATLPFETDKYYYLGTAGDSPVMLSTSDSKSVSYRAKAQAEVINDIPNDLWYVTGNVFDGFYFYNVTAGTDKPAMSQYDVRKTSYSSLSIYDYEKTLLAFEKGSIIGATPCKVWDIKKSANGFLIYTHADDNNKTGEDYNRFWSYADNAIKFNNADGAVKEFALYEPEFTFPLVTVGNASYNSIALPFAAKLAEGETTKMYKGKIDGNVLDAEEVTTGLPAAPTGAVLVKEAIANSAKFVAVKEVPAIDNSDFIGTTTSITKADLSNYLIFGGDASTGEVGFYSAASDLKANRAYLPKPSSNVKSLSIRIGGQPTGITVPTDFAPAKSNAPVYDLSGRRVTNTVKGHLYIQNGRKFIAE